MRRRTVSQTKTQLAKAQGDLKTASQNLASTVTEKDQLTSRLSGVQTDLEKTKAQVAQLTNDRTSLEGQISQLTADLQAKTQELEQKSTPGSASPAEGGTDQQAQVAEQQTLISKLQGDLDSARFQLATLQKEKEDRMQQKMRNGLSGRVLAVNPAWNFVVLSLGDKNGVVNNAELLVKRGSQYHRQGSRDFRRAIHIDRGHRREQRSARDDDFSWRQRHLPSGRPIVHALDFPDIVRASWPFGSSAVRKTKSGALPRKQEALFPGTGRQSWEGPGMIGTQIQGTQ